MTRILIALTGVFLCSLPAAAAVQTKKITYKDGDTVCHGFLAYDDAVKGPRPGVLVVDEWWGLSGYGKQRAEQLAKLGYVAFVADMYGEGKVVDHPKDAGAMASKVRANVEAWRKRALAGLNVLREQPQVDKTRLAAIGYCFGGSTALQLALAGTPDLKAVVSFHGALPEPTPAEAKQVKAAILVAHGADDAFIPEKAIKAFRGALDAAGVKYDFVAYPGAKHSFTVPDADKRGIDGIKYDKAADEASWQAMQKLFKEKLEK
jgi:dienelactone hydrolase